MDEIWINEDWFHAIPPCNFGDNGKAIPKSPSDNLARWINMQSKCHTRKGIKKVSRSVRVYIYIVLTSQAQARLRIVDNSAFAVHASQVFKCTFNVLINENYFIRVHIDRYQSVLQHVLLKLAWSIGPGFYMLPCFLDLSKGKTWTYTNTDTQTLIINSNMKIDVNRNINEDETCHHKSQSPVLTSEAYGFPEMY